ncbi:MAG: flagellar biosynthesis protein FlhB [Chloroflexi bacterium HGW-Chloroflexi-10]|nr:MAG: flagellar biosynthesis protein FlhB [Chloroflexi bacterium HGW-Chloroflexi-10]
MSDRTEKPTPQKLREARNEGRVPRSIEVNSAVLMLVSVFLLQGPGRTMVTNLKWIMTDTIASLPTVELNIAYLQRLALDTILAVTPSMLIMALGIMISGITVTVAQTGFMWASKNIGFKFDRVNPINGFKRIFSSRGVIELLRALIKLLVVSYVTYSFFKVRAFEVENLLLTDLTTAVGNFVAIAVDLTMRIGTAYGVLAAADYAYQRWDFMKNLRMTKQEIKEEYKRSEGDPIYKGRIRQMQRQMARNRMMSNVPKATVVVTNPTHLAVAIEYQSGMSAPRVVAKGANKVAEKIKEIAAANNVPVIENKPLARSLYKTVEIDQEIAPEFYLAVAELLTYVYRIQGRVPRPAAA